MPDVRMGWELMGKLRAILAHLYYTQADYYGGLFLLIMLSSPKFAVTCFCKPLFNWLFTVICEIKVCRIVFFS